MRRRMAWSAGRMPAKMPEAKHQRHAEDQKLHRQIEHRQHRGNRASPGSEKPGRAQPGQAAHGGEQTGLRQHQDQHQPVGEAHGLEHAQFPDPLPHRLRHRVAGHQQDGEEHRGQNGDQDRADVAHLLHEALGKRALRFGLGFVGRVGEFGINRLRDLRGSLRVGTTRPTYQPTSPSPKDRASSK